MRDKKINRKGTGMGWGGAGWDDVKVMQKEINHKYRKKYIADSIVFYQCDLAASAPCLSDFCAE